MTTDVDNASDRTIALVTGANKGIGRAIAERLAGLGMTVCVAARDAGRGEQAAAALRAAGADPYAVVLDVTVPATVAAAAAEVSRRYGRLDVLINNAGISGRTDGALDGRDDLATVRTVYETNVFGVISVTEAFLPLLRRSRAPRVVNISSGVGSLGMATDPEHYLSKLPASLAYATSKTALNALTVQYAKDLAPDRILVNAVTPGACATDFTRGVPWPISRTAAQGAEVAVRLATIGPDGPTGGLFDDDGPVPW